MVNRLDERARTGILAGLLAGSCALLLSFLLGLKGISFTPSAAGQAFIELLPGWVSVPLIELLHEWAKRLLVVGICALFLVSFALAGWWAVDARVEPRRVLAAAVLP